MVRLLIAQIHWLDIQCTRVDSMTYYTLSRVSRNLAVAIGQRRQRISKTHNLSPRQHHYNLTSISYTRYTSNRIIPFNQSLHCFSTLSTIEDDKESSSSGLGSDDDLDGLKSEIERLKNLDGGDDNVSSFARDINTADDESDGSKLNLLNVMKSSPFEPPASSQPNINTTEKDTKPNLSELLSNNDIFAQSWAEPDVEDEEYPSSSNTRSNNEYYNSSGRYDRGSSSYRRNSGYNSTNNRPRDYYRDRQRSDTNSRVNVIGRKRNDNWSPSHTNSSISWRDNVNDKNEPTTSYQQPSYQSTQQQQSIEAEQQPPSLIEIEYNKLVDCTNQLLDLLSNNKYDLSTTTLQLMDFDKVMTDLSKFHLVVDNSTNKNNNSDNGSFSSYYGSATSTASLETKASNQCMKLLHALEYNYDCILNHSLPDSLQSSEEEELPQTKYTQLIPNAVSYNLALHTLAHSDHQHNMAQEAYSILIRMLDRYQKYIDITTDADMSVKQQLPKPCEPTIITYNSVLHAIAKSGTNDAGHLAEQVFDMMMDKSSSFSNRVHPNARTLACVIDAWSNVKSSTNTQQMYYSPERAEAILNVFINKRRAFVESVTGVVLQDEHHDDHVDIPTDTDVEEESIQIVMHEDSIVLDDDDDDVIEETIDDELQLTTTETTMSSLSTDIHKSKQEEEVQQRVPSQPFVKPNIVAFNSCIHAWASSGRGREGAHRAQELLAQLELLSNSGELDLPLGHPDEIANYVDDDSLDNSVKPNVRTYSMIMNAWSNVARVEQGSGEDAATHCEDILTKMEEQGAIDSSVRPNLVAYVTSISCWARTRDVEHAASRAENILNRMIDLYYNEDKSELPIIEGDIENANHDAPFNSVITSYARSSDPYATERALSVLERLEASLISPTIVTYNAVLDVCAKKGEPDRALEVLEKMKQIPSISLDSTSYDTVLDAFARCEKIGSSERAYNYLCQLEEERLKGESTFTPSGRSYTNVITAFARQSGNDSGGISTVHRAKEVYDKLIKQIEEGVLQNGNVDSFANSSLLNCCANVYGTRSEKKEALVIAVSTKVECLLLFESRYSSHFHLSFVFRLRRLRK